MASEAVVPTGQVGRRLTMTFVISRRTYNVRISISMFGIEIEISVQ